MPGEDRRRPSVAKIIRQKICQNIILNGSQQSDYYIRAAKSDLYLSISLLKWRKAKSCLRAKACEIWLFTALTSVGVIAGVTPLRRRLLYISLRGDNFNSSVSFRVRWSPGRRSLWNNNTIGKEILAAATRRRGLAGFLKQTAELVLVELLSFFNILHFSHTKAWKWEHYCLMKENISLIGQCERKAFHRIYTRRSSHTEENDITKIRSVQYKQTAVWQKRKNLFSCWKLHLVSVKSPTLTALWDFIPRPDCKPFGGLLQQPLQSVRRLLDGHQSSLTVNIYCMRRALHPSASEPLKCGLDGISKTPSPPAEQLVCHSSQKVRCKVLCSPASPLGARLWSLLPRAARLWADWVDRLGSYGLLLQRQTGLGGFTVLHYSIWWPINEML